MIISNDKPVIPTYCNDKITGEKIFNSFFNPSWTLPNKQHYEQQTYSKNDWTYWGSYNNFAAIMEKDRTYDIIKKILELTKSKLKPFEISPTTKSNFIDSSTGQQTLGCQEIANFIAEAYPWVVNNECLYYFSHSHWKPVTLEIFSQILQNDFCDTEEAKLFSSLNDGLLRNIYNILRRRNTLKIDEKIFYETEENFINFLNGTYDLQTQTLQPFNPEFYCKNTIDAEYEPGENGDFFETYIDGITNSNSSIRQRILECLGYCLANDMNAKVIPLILGPGNSGKSTFGNFLRALVGSNNTVAIPMGNYDSKYVTNELVGRKIAIDVDAANKIYNASVAHVLKQLSGNDLIAAEEKYGALYSFKNTCKIVIISNSMPRFNPYDEQLNSRWLKIPFPYSVQVKDTKMLEKLLENRNYIISESIKAFIKLKNNNYQFTNIGDWETYEPTGSHKGYRIQKNNDGVISFIEKYCIVSEDPKDVISIQKLYESYENFSNQFDDLYSTKPVSKLTFAKILRQYLGDKIQNAGNGQNRSIRFIKLTAD